MALGLLLYLMMKSHDFGGNHDVSACIALRNFSAMVEAWTYALDSGLD